MNPDSLPSPDAWLAEHQRLMLALIDHIRAYPSAAPQGAQPAEPVAWLCEWAEWSQYHDANDPLPETWDSAAPLKITPLYASPADAAPVPQEVERDAMRLDYLQRTGSTIDLPFSGRGFRFRVGGLPAAVHHDLRTAIDAAMNAGLTIPAKERTK